MTTTKTSSAWLGVVTVVMTLVGWSSVPLFLSHFARSIDLWTSNGWRYGFSALVWLPWLIVRKDGWNAAMWRAGIVPALFNAFGQTAFAWAFYNLDPATATFGMRAQIVFVSIGAYLMFPSERAVLRRPLAWVGMLLVLSGILGTILLREKGAGDVMPVQTGIWIGGAGFGMVMAVSAGFLFAGYGLSVRKCMTGEGGGFHPVTAFAAISQYSAIITVALMLVLARDPVSHQMDFGMSVLGLPGMQIFLLLLSAVIGIALGHVFYYFSLARLGVAVTSAVIQLQPFLVGAGQAVLFDKLLTTRQWWSGGVAVVGAVLLLWVQWRVMRKATVSPES